MNYRGFYPVASESGEATSPWGRIPVWGFATVTESRTEGTAVGEKFYYYTPHGQQRGVDPSSGECLLDKLVDSRTASRSTLSSLYNQYVLQHRPVRHPRHRDRSPCCALFITSWLIDDFLANNAFFGTTTSGQRAR